jgi:uncharacterized protein (DUF885 family)
LLTAYDEKLRTQVLPAYRRLHDYLAREYLPHARDTVAWSELPSGDLWYAHLVRQHTSLDLTPAAVHELGLGEVARLRVNLVALQGPLGVPGDARTLFDAIRADPRFHFSSARLLLNAYEGMRGPVEARLAAPFLRRPRAAMEIRALEGFRAGAAGPTSYLIPSADGSRPAVFYVNTSELASRPVFDIEAQYLRGAVPGRHHQVALAQETPNLPRFRRFGSDSAYVEGWASYAVSLGGALGLQANPYTQFGALNLELLEAARLVIDTGLHAQGWSRERAQAYLRANTALGEAAIAAEVDHCIALPAQALAGAVGRLKLLELRRTAETRLGDRFDVRAFHEQVVGAGSLPLTALEAKLTRWSAASR